jgi:hypothetical protein
MKAITAEELLCAWEKSLSQPSLQRSFILLSTAFPEILPDTLLNLSIGQRDRHLLQLREKLFGQQLLNSAVCPECKQQIEWENSITDLIDPRVETNVAENEFNLNVDDYDLHFRLPNSLDLAAVINNSDANIMQQHLLSRCLLNIEYSGVSFDISQLPDNVITQLDQRIAALDPQADIRINLNCPECSHSWDVLFDISSFLWREVNDWAEQMLRTVYKLAMAYGWSEREILNLTPVRRQLYLGMLE